MCCCHFDTILSLDFDQDLSRGLVHIQLLFMEGLFGVYIAKDIG